ncbi:hypothetical protein BXZ70DRAFT_453860 [Cristinia sonorae]|uniref:Uncharacterized protein n=1 Tax=Cristinia sonorae TaxID=1940300 RepID=A0A8K0XM65_9AGAR|nr:hypothetical protein BXZ70DRAFT_453860 [Cristinia sonorae]
MASKLWWHSTPASNLARVTWRNMVSPLLLERKDYRRLILSLRFGRWRDWIEKRCLQGRPHPCRLIVAPGTNIVLMSESVHPMVELLNGTRSSLQMSSSSAECQCWGDGVHHDDGYFSLENASVSPLSDASGQRRHLHLQTGKGISNHIPEMRPITSTVITRFWPIIRLPRRLP